MAMHAKSGGNIEVMGMLQGKVVGQAFVVVDAFALPVEGTETRVNAQTEAYEYMVDFAETTKVGRCHEAVCRCALECMTCISVENSDERHKQRSAEAAGKQDIAMSEGDESWLWQAPIHMSIIHLCECLDSQPCTPFAEPSYKIRGGE